MSVPVLVAVAGAPWEPRVLAGLESAGSSLRVVRRCVDLADLLATAATGVAKAALVATDLRRLDRDAIARLMSSGVVPVGLLAPGDPVALVTLHGLGIAHVVPADASSDTLMQVVTKAVAAGPMAGAPARTLAGPARALAGTPTPDAAPVAGRPGSPAGESGHLVAVWGPTGAPGRTSLAVALAGELAASGHRTLLADADVYGGTVAQHLGLLGEPPGLAAAARLSATAALDPAGLERLAAEVAPGLRVLAGISRAERWPELRPAALESVWTLTRHLAAQVVVDCGFSLEQDEELSFDVAAPRRNGATLTTLECADTILAVGAADPVGIARLVRGLAQLRDVVPGASVRVVVNKLRKGAVGPSPEQQVRAALSHYAGADEILLVPHDLAAADAALLAGRTWAEAAPRSPARLAVSSLAESLTGAPRGSGRRRGLLRRRAA